MRPRQLTYLGEIQKVVQNGTPLPGMLPVLLNPFQDPFLGLFVIWPDGDAAAAHGRWSPTLTSPDYVVTGTSGLSTLSLLVESSGWERRFLVFIGRKEDWI